MKPLRIVIIEDEAAIARELSHVITAVDCDCVVITVLHSVADSVSWLDGHTGQYDLIFMDIRLSDGLSFDIFKRTKISLPVIFVTAYHDYAIQAFKNNGIDYILKPFNENEISQALKKFHKFYRGGEGYQLTAEVEQMLQQMAERSRSYRKSFLVHFREKLIPVEVARIAWFYTAHDLVYAMSADEKQYLIDFTMEQLTSQLDPIQFFRANRQYIVHRKMIGEVDLYFNGRLSVKMKPEPPSAVLISKARAPEFKAWMDR